jgi:hypothetical protein
LISAQAEKLRKLEDVLREKEEQLRLLSRHQVIHSLYSN